MGRAKGSKQHAVRGVGGSFVSMNLDNLSASTSSNPSSQSPRVRQPQRTQGTAPTLQEKVESLEKAAVATAAATEQLSRENEGLLAKVVEQGIALDTLRAEKDNRGKLYILKKDRIQNAQPASSQSALGVDTSRATTLSVDLSTCNSVRAKWNKKQRIVTEIETFLEQRFTGSDTAQEDAIQYYLAAPQRVGMLKRATVATGLDIIHYLDAKHQMEKKWSAEQVMFLKQQTGMSRRQTQTADRVLSYEYDEVDNKFKLSEFTNGVQFPSISKFGSRHKLEQLAENLYGQVQPMASTDGNQVTVSIKKVLELELKDKKSHLYGQKVVRVILAGDGAGLFRNITHVNLGLTILAGLASQYVTQDDRDRLTQWTTICTYEGGDKLKEIQAACADRLTSELDELHTQGLTLDDNNKVECVLMMGADQSMMISACAIAGASCYCPCYLCCKKKVDFADLEKPQAQRRTVQNITEGAHLPHADTVFPFKCPHCDKVFPTAQSMRDEEFPVTKTGTHQTRHQQGHTSIYWHTPMLWPFIAIFKRVFDLLHWLQRFSGRV